MFDIKLMFIHSKPKPDIGNQVFVWQRIYSFKWATRPNVKMFIRVWEQIIVLTIKTLEKCSKIWQPILIFWQITHAVVQVWPMYEHGFGLLCYFMDLVDFCGKMLQKNVAYVFNCKKCSMTLLHHVIYRYISRFVPQ